MAGIEWMFTLIDQASGPAKTITKNIQTLQKATQAADKAAERTGAGVRDAMGKIGRKAEEGVRGFSGTISTLGRGGIFKALGDSASQVSKGVQGAFRGIGQSFRRVFNLPSAIIGGFAAWGGKLVLDAIGWRESTLDALELLMGGQKEAMAVMKVIEGLAEQTTLPMEVIADAMTKFLRTGKATVGETETMIRALADAVTTKGMSPEVFEAGAEGIRRMLGTAKLTALNVRSITRQLGLDQVEFVEQLGKTLQKSPKQIDEMFKKGQIAGRAGADALVKTIIATINRGKPLGTATDREKQTLPGIFRDLRNTIRDFFKKLDIGEMPGLKPLKDFISSITRILKDPTMKQAATRFVSDVLQVIFGPLADFTTPDKIMEFMKDFPKRLEVATAGARGFGEGVKEGFKMLGDAWKTVSPYVTEIMKFLGVAMGPQKAARAPLVRPRGMGERAWEALQAQEQQKAATEQAEAAGKLAGKFVTLGATASVAAPLVGGLGKALWSVAGALGIAGLGVLAAVAAFTYFYNKSPEFRKAVDTVSEGWKDLRKRQEEWDPLSIVDRDVLRPLQTYIEDVVSRAATDFWEGLRKMYNYAKEFFPQLIQSMATGVENAKTRLGELVKGLYELIPEWARKALGWGSPSRVAMSIGRGIPEGLSKGIESGTDSVTRALQGIASNMPAMGAVMPGRGRMPAAITLTVNVDGGQTPRETAAAVAQSVTSSLSQWFDLLAQEGGGVPVPVPD